MAKNAIDIDQVVGLIQALAPAVDGGTIQQVVTEWLDDHPEATTTVTDGSITEAKLAAAVMQKLGLVTQLSDEIVALKPVYGKSKPSVILMPEFASDFWIGNYMAPGLYKKQTVFTVSGNEGDTFLTVSNTTPDTVTPASVTQATGFVLTTDDIAYEPYNAMYNETEGKLEIYPPLSRNIENGKFCQFALDGGASYSCLHLTEHGYKAYIYNLYNKNPKHCEIGLYNAMYDAERDTTAHPFRKISDSSATPLYIGRSANSQSGSWLRNYFPSALNAAWSVSYASYEAKNGIYWETDLHGTSGYLELYTRAAPGLPFINPINPQLPADQHIFVDVYIDGVLASRTEINDFICRRICVDYENATTGKVEIYANKFASIDGTNGFGFGVNKCTWWINQIDYPENAKLFPTGAFVAQEFDSWGVFNDGVTGKTLQALISADAGVTVPLENHSLGSQTTAWGLAYWYQHILAYHPQIAITDFVLNDNNSQNAGVPATITGPDGKEYNNKITAEMYAHNMEKLAIFALNNGIQPILMRNCQYVYYLFPNTAINYLSKQYET